MEDYTRLSDTELARQWLAQFRTPYDRNIAKELLNSLKYVSNREFEISIEKKLIELQDELEERIAVYPIVKTDVQSSIFEGKLPSEDIIESNSKPPREGKKKKYGSEDRIGSILEKISCSIQRTNGLSEIESIPTITSLTEQGIKSIVLIDDICGSGDRFIGFYKNIFPSSVKRQISLKKLKLWVIFYASNPEGIRKIQKKFKYFRKNPDRILTIFPGYNIFDSNLEIKRLCERIGLGYKNSMSNVVFEHGCPNNLPEFLWRKSTSWKPLFPERSIPIGLRPSFGQNSTADLGNVLWETGQNYLALSLYDSIDNHSLNANDSLKISVLGLIIRQVKVENLGKRLFIDEHRINSIMKDLVDYNIIIIQRNEIIVSELGKGIVNTFRKTQLKKDTQQDIDKLEPIYYPSQCDGHFKSLGRLSSDSKGDCTGKSF